MYYVYALTDPRDGIVRYVGATKNPKSRYRSHLNTIPQKKYRKNPKWLWICELKKKFMYPTLSILAKVDTVQEARRIEILEYKKHKDTLLCVSPSRCPYRGETKSEVTFVTSKKVYQYDLNKSLIAIYPSVSIAIRKTGCSWIRNTLSGKTKRPKNFIFSYTPL